MAAQVRQEINILDHVLPSISGGNTISNEIAQLDTTQYNGTVTYYFEFVALNTNASVGYNVWLTAATDGTKGSTQIPANTSAYTLFRSSVFTLATATQNGTVSVNATAIASQVLVKSARIVIIQNADTLTNTETQIEIGNYNLARTTESAIALVNPKYWKYDASKWDGTKTFYAEAVYNSGDHNTISVYLYEATDITAPSWTLNATIVSAATTPTHPRTRIAFTPVDGQWYTIFSLN